MGVMTLALGVFAALVFTRPLPGDVTVVPYHPLRIALQEQGSTPLTFRDVVVSSAALLGIAIYCIVSVLVITGLYHRTASGEVFFFLSFVTSLSVEALRLASLYVVLFVRRPTICVAITRIVYMARLFGLCSFFFASLYAAGFRYSDFAVLSGIALLIAVIMGSTVPIDSSILHSTYLYRISDGVGLLSITLTIQLIILISALAAPIIRRSLAFVWYAVSTVCLLVGRELLLLSGRVALPVGLVLLVVGVFLLSRVVERYYLRIF